MVSDQTANDESNGGENNYSDIRAADDAQYVEVATDGGVDVPPVPDINEPDDNTHVSWRPVGAVECSECGRAKQSGGYLVLREEGAVLPKFEGLVCASCKAKLTDDE